MLLRGRTRSGVTAGGGDDDGDDEDDAGVEISGDGRRDQDLVAAAKEHMNSLITFPSMARNFFRSPAFCREKHDAFLQQLQQLLGNDRLETAFAKNDGTILNSVRIIISLTTGYHNVT